jgi:hypothetical protein
VYIRKKRCVYDERSPFRSCVRCKKSVVRGRSNGDTLNLVTGDDVPIYSSGIDLFMCGSCQSTNNCAWCGKGFRFTDEETPLKATTIQWISIPEDKWIAAKKGNGKKSNKTRGFCPSPNDNVHAVCLSQMRSCIGKLGKKKAKAPSEGGEGGGSCSARSISIISFIPSD